MPIDNTITVEAGCILKSVQDAAAAVDRLFPLSLASEGSCRIGGNLSTNAGGLNVIAYGNARDLCLGLEVVLADGRVWNGLKRLRKDNTGYDLRDLFIGAEGTLGIITAAVLKLFPRPQRHETAFIAVPGPQAAVELLSLLRAASGNRVVAFELIASLALQFTERHAGLRSPLESASPWYVLAELADPLPGAFTALLEEAMDKGLVTDAAIAQSDRQRDAFWTIRETISDSQKPEGGSIKHDIAVPVSQVPRFLAAADAAVARFMPGARLVTFGHLGDGNIHYNVSQPVGMDTQQYPRSVERHERRGLRGRHPLRRLDQRRARHGEAQGAPHAADQEPGGTRDDARPEAPLRSQYHPQSRPGAARMTAFREIEDRDVEAVVALWRPAGLRGRGTIRTRTFPSRGKAASSTILVAERDGRIIASVMAGHDGHRGMLYYVAVDPALRREGLGKAAVRAAEDWLGQRGVWKINLLVRSENDAVRGFYEALGYEVSPVFCMARKIAP